MQLRDIIHATKTVHDYGEWKIGTIPKAAFPLRKKKIQQSNEWQWRRVELTALDERFIVLIRLNCEIQEYYAYLGHVRAEGLAVICSHDLHVSHKNWHCHLVKGNVLRTDVGYLRDKNSMVWYPSGGKETPCTVEFDITLQTALQHAAKRFRFAEPPQSELGI